MKRLYALAALLLVAFTLPSEAAWNIRQKGSGAAVWMNERSVEIPVGSAGIAVSITSMAVAQSYFVTVHKPGKLKYIYGVAPVFQSGSTKPNFTFQIARAATNYYTAISKGASLALTTTAGLPTLLTPTDLNIDVVQGGTIAVFSVGGTTNIGPATLTIVIE